MRHSLSCLSTISIAESLLGALITSWREELRAGCCYVSAAELSLLPEPCKYRLRVEGVARRAAPKGRRYMSPLDDGMSPRDSF